MRLFVLLLVFCLIIAACSRKTESISATVDMTGSDQQMRDPELTPEEREIMKKLSSADVEKIDKTLLANASCNWRKVARIVGSSMIVLENEKQYEEIPDIYYSERVRDLVQRGLLESEGDLYQMRFSEVRLPSK